VLGELEVERRQLLGGRGFDDHVMGAKSEHFEYILKPWLVDTIRVRGKGNYNTVGLSKADLILIPYVWNYFTIHPMVKLKVIEAVFGHPFGYIAYI
jgi:hypothetical protein